MGGGDKLLAPLEGRPLLAWTLAPFQQNRRIGEIVLVASAESLDNYRSLVVGYGFSKVTRIVPGGSQRQDSVRQGLEAVPEADWIAVHDAARPLLAASDLDRVLEASGGSEAAILAMPCINTVKTVNEDMIITTTPPRESIYLACTPQVFPAAWLRDALKAADGKGEVATDDSALVSSLGHPVRIVECGRENLKVTTPLDLVLAAALLKQRRGR